MGFAAASANSPPSAPPPVSWQYWEPAGCREGTQRGAGGHRHCAHLSSCVRGSEPIPQMEGKKLQSHPYCPSAHADAAPTQSTGGTASSARGQPASPTPSLKPGQSCRARPVSQKALGQSQPSPQQVCVTLPPCMMKPPHDYTLLQFKAPCSPLLGGTKGLAHRTPAQGPSVGHPWPLPGFGR